LGLAVTVGLLEQMVLIQPLQQTPQLVVDGEVQVVALVEAVNGVLLEELEMLDHIPHRKEITEAMVRQIQEHLMAEVEAEAQVRLEVMAPDLTGAMAAMERPHQLQVRL
jgi:hypothetical protein